MNFYLENYRLSGGRYANIIRDTEVPPNNAPVIGFNEPMVECKKMKARVRESYCGLHASCKGCEREFVNVDLEDTNEC